MQRCESALRLSAPAGAHAALARPRPYSASTTALRLCRSTTQKGGANGSLRYELTEAANSDSRMVLAMAYIDKWAEAINARLANMTAQQAKVRACEAGGRSSGASAPASGGL